MTLNDAMLEIEGDEFSALINLASGMATFERLLNSQPAFQRIRQFVEMRSATSADVLGRIQELTARPVEPDFEHPSDAALAAYVALLDAAESPQLSSALSRVASCANCWWARKVADRIAERRRKSKSANTRSGDALPVTALNRNSVTSFRSPRKIDGGVSLTFQGTGSFTVSKTPRTFNTAAALSVDLTR